MSELCESVCGAHSTQDLSDGDRANYEQNIQDAMATFHKVWCVSQQ